MKRKLYILANIISILIAIMISIFWIRSYSQADRIHGHLEGRQSFIIASKQGELTFVWFRWHGAEGGWPWGLRSYPVEDELSFPVGYANQYVNQIGFGRIINPMYFIMRSAQDTPNGRIHFYGAATATLRGDGWIIPYWFVLIFSLIFPAIWIIRCFRKQFLPRAGYCQHCGYDLRATPDRCPECGLVVNSEAAKQNVDRCPRNQTNQSESSTTTQAGR